jgi:hypothetical protein
MIVQPAAEYTGTSVPGIVISTQTALLNDIVDFINSNVHISSMYVAGYKNQVTGYPYTDKAEIIIYDGTREIKFDIQNVTNQSTWAATEVTSTSGSLVEGKTYNIAELESGDDFSNVGYVEEGTDFVATGTTPTTWDQSTEVLNVTDSSLKAALTVAHIDLLKMLVIISEG